MVSGSASAAISVAATAGGSQLTTSPPRSLRDGTPASPFTVTAACPICRASCERDTDPICSARNRSSRCPTAAGATTNRRAAVTSPDLRLDVAPRLEKHVDQGAIVDPLLEDLGRHAALVERAPLFDLVAHGVEQVVPLDPLDDLLLVVHREVRGDGARQLPRAFGLVDEGHAPECNLGRPVV